MRTAITITALSYLWNVIGIQASPWIYVPLIGMALVEDIKTLTK